MSSVASTVFPVKSRAGTRSAHPPVEAVTSAWLPESDSPTAATVPGIASVRTIDMWVGSLMSTTWMTPEPVCVSSPLAVLPATSSVVGFTCTISQRFPSPPRIVDVQELPDPVVVRAVGVQQDPVEMRARRVGDVDREHVAGLVLDVVAAE